MHVWAFFSILYNFILQNKGLLHFSKKGFVCVFQPALVQSFVKFETSLSI